MDRRGFLLALAAGVAGTALARGAAAPDAPPAALGGPAASPGPVGDPVARWRQVHRGVPGVEPQEPPAGVVDALPGEGDLLALTIDDGTSSEVVAAFARFAADSGTRMTFFPNGRYRAWEDNAALLRPLVDSGQVALGNHTWSHPDLTTLGDAEVAEEIRRNRDFLRSTFGVETPFFRPPFGAHDERTDRIAADLGHPTIAMWNGTLEDYRVLTAEELVAAARRWFSARTIVVGHANHPTVTTVYGQLLELVAERGLTTVTLADVWATRR
ncbi:polysaccharide deacetylase family protein [Blastococcus sp. MG754426]|uniref:polysaccharide deacetylase family protein n=1 Tax=unclassified Blastococcus TaxID=2619396 RepID=UPI001EF076D8|nr:MULTISPECIES: polysaccharide deacetylase family protein [unclassified Blastococcus]MCF6506898.1 polysaccharide deacetylase family protein [Blastococcus sp. MG754426]MCF6511856.1 polysaccharide deacetylase family protein [Blastococcus sp. MG754427]MCF6736789.1 polysaccharide deacetylase family protein [Blastococcus sp. KM273129]